jgi:hypothetical protein
MECLTVGEGSKLFERSEFLDHATGKCGEREASGQSCLAAFLFIVFLAVKEIMNEVVFVGVSIGAPPKVSPYGRE